MSIGPTQQATLFRAIYDAELAWLLRTIRRLGARPRDVEDLAHDILHIVYRRLASFDQARPVRPWLYGIAVRVVSDYRRRASFSREELPGDLDASDPETNTPEEDLVTRRQRALVLSGLDALDEHQRVVLVAHDLDGTTIPELAEVLAVPLNTLYSRLRLARQRFAAAVERLLKQGEAA